MATNREPVLKRCRSLQIDPSHLGIFKESKESSAEKHEKNERIWSPASRKAESQVRLRRRRKAVQKYIQQSSEEKGYHW